VAILHSYIQAGELGLGILHSHHCSLLQQKDCSSVVAASAGEEQRRQLETKGDVRNYVRGLQWNFSIEDTLMKGHISNEDSVCRPNHIELCTNLSLN